MPNVSIRAVERALKPPASSADLARLSLSEGLGVTPRQSTMTYTLKSKASANYSRAISRGRMKARPSSNNIERSFHPVSIKRDARAAFIRCLSELKLDSGAVEPRG